MVLKSGKSLLKKIASNYTEARQKSALHFFETFEGIPPSIREEFVQQFLRSFYLRSLKANFKLNYGNLKKKFPSIFFLNSQKYERIELKMFE